LLNRLFQPKAETLLCSSIRELLTCGRLENLESCESSRSDAE
jgi:hypothetical protein